MRRSRKLNGGPRMGLLLIAAVAGVMPATPGTAMAEEPIPSSATRIAFFEPGQAPPHVVLGVVHTFRRQGQLTHSVYEETALKARACGGDMVVETIAGEDDPLQEGYIRWVIGFAARSAASISEGDTLAACRNCLVAWTFDASDAGTTDSTEIAQLEAKAFSTSRLKLAKYGYYLVPSPPDPPLALEVRLSRSPVEGSEDLLAFSSRMVWVRDGTTFWRFTHALRIPRGRRVEYLGRDRQLAHNALSGLYRRLPSEYHDSDGDGVPDIRDLEPNTPPGYQVDLVGRTLDSDGDGVPNTIDDQPFTIPKYRLMVGSNGVPIVVSDSDYDGVPDSEDPCPDTNVRYVVDERGCPVEESEIIAILVDRGVLQERRIHFETGKAVLLNSSRARLDSLGAALSGLPELRFHVDGHCDFRGSDAFNQTLSEERSAAVVDYLVANFPGLSPGQFTARGFGKSRPVADGGDDRSLELNRRVEITVQNPEDAIRHVEGTRYRLRHEAVDGYQFEASTGG